MSLSRKDETITFHLYLKEVIWCRLKILRCSLLVEMPSFNYKSNFSDFVFFAEWQNLIGPVWNQTFFWSNTFLEPYFYPNTFPRQSWISSFQCPQLFIKIYNKSKSFENIPYVEENCYSGHFLFELKERDIVKILQPRKFACGQN